MSQSLQLSRSFLVTMEESNSTLKNIWEQAFTPAANILTNWNTPSYVRNQHEPLDKALDTAVTTYINGKFPDLKFTDIQLVPAVMLELDDSRITPTIINCDIGNHSSFEILISLRSERLSLFGMTGNYLLLSKVGDDANIFFWEIEKDVTLISLQ